MPGGKGKSSGGKSSGGKTSVDGHKKQMSHSARAGLQVRYNLTVATSSSFVSFFFFAASRQTPPHSLVSPQQRRFQVLHCPASLPTNPTRSRASKPQQPTSRVIATYCTSLRHVATSDATAFCDGLDGLGSQNRRLHGLIACGGNDTARRWLKPVLATGSTSSSSLYSSQLLIVAQCFLLSSRLTIRFFSSSLAVVSSVSSRPTPSRRCVSVPRPPSTLPLFSST